MTPWVQRLLIANVLVFALQYFSPGVTSMLMFYPTEVLHRPWTLVTYMFVHGSIGHIFFNMLALYFFGPPVEQRMGENRFITLYLISGIVGALLSMVLGNPILGASGAGDIGRHFPDTDSAWKDADSIDLLRRAAVIVRDTGYAIVNIDVTVIAQRPKLSPHAATMQRNLSSALGISPGQVSVKGKTNEGVDSMGAGESIAVHAVALITRLRS